MSEPIDVIGLDSGRSGIKAESERERIYFRSSVGTYRNLRNGRELKHDEFIVQYKTEHFFVGQIAADESDDGAQMMLPYKAHTDTKILVLTALHRLVENGARVLVVTGLPIAMYVEHDKQQMKQLLLGEHQLRVNNVSKRFTIERVEVSAEGAAVAWSLGRYRRERFHIVDVGSRTVNFVTVVNGKWVDRDSGSLDYGAETFQGSESQFARVIIADLSRRLRPLGPVVLIGGKETIVEYLRDYHTDIEVHQDALFANANAFRQIGVIANARQTAQAASR